MDIAIWCFHLTFYKLTIEAEIKLIQGLRYHSTRSKVDVGIKLLRIKKRRLIFGSNSSEIRTNV